MKVKKGEFFVNSVIDDIIIVEYRGRIIQMYSFMDEIRCSVMDENGKDDKSFYCLYEAMEYIDEITK